MRQRWARRRVDERGLALVEAPMSIILMLAIGFSALWVANIALRYHQLEEAVRAGVRYAARSHTASPIAACPDVDAGSRRRTVCEIEEFTRQAAQPIVVDAAGLTIRCGPSPEDAAMAPCPNPDAQPPGSYIEVSATATVASGDPIMAIARSVNDLFSALRAGEPLPESVSVTEASVAIIE